MGFWARAAAPLPSPTPIAAPSGRSEARLRKSLRLSFSSTIHLLIFRDDLPVVAHAEQLERVEVDGDRQRLDAAVAKDKLADAGVPAAEGLIGPLLAIRV